MTETAIPAKVCSMCGKLKALTEYHVDNSKRDGRVPRCKDCARGHHKSTPARAAGSRAATRKRDAAHKEWLWALKSEPCTDCRLTWPPYVMQFDHVPGRGAKSFAVNLSCASRMREVILAEIAKCDLVCANCHFIRTQERREA